MVRWTLSCVLVGLLACGGGEEPEAITPYRLRQALLIGPDKGGTPEALDHVCDDAADRDACRDGIEQCGQDAYADVVVDEDGSLLDVLCYGANVTVREVGDDPVANEVVGNHTVLVLDDVDDGADVTGDVTLSGNGAVLYGKGADVSVIGGTLAIEKNNAIVRGVRIQGDVTVVKNNIKLAFCEIDGDLTLSGNNATVAECIVHGRVLIGGINTVFAQNELGANDALSGKNLRCNANVSFEDSDADGSVSDAELGRAVTCSGG
ncbi:MAG: hypothetical protein ABI895_09295 [Deltaproteobacteria bacterium]